MTVARPYPLYTDGSNLYTSFDGGATLITLENAGGTAQTTYSAVIDLTVTGTYQLIPPTPARVWLVSTPFFEIKSVTTCTVSPTFSYGSNSASFNNLGASQTVATFTTQAAETRVITTVVNPQVLVDLTTNGLWLNVTAGATATALTARFYISFGLLPV